jgi:RNA polymerase sigma-70 factor (sigma-E family)
VRTYGWTGAGAVSERGQPGPWRSGPDPSALEQSGASGARGASGASGASGADFEAFAAARWSRLVRTAYLLTGDHHEAEDLVQVTLAKVFPGWAAISRLDEPDAYVHRALINNNRSRYRRRRVRQLLTPILPELAQEDGGRTVEERSLLIQALAELPPSQRAVVVLRYWEDLSEQQVADALGCSLGNVKSQANRGLRRLRQHPALASYAPVPDLEGAVPR